MFVQIDQKGVSQIEGELRSVKLALSDKAAHVDAEDAVGQLEFDEGECDFE